MQLELKASAVIQARLGSTRLPGKALRKVMGKTILGYVIERVSKAASVKEIIVATTTNDEDLRIVDLANKLGVKVYRGSERDVLDRYYQTAKLFKIKDMVRITADCPLIDPRIIDNVVRHYFDNHADYCSNTLVETFPDGEDCEVFSFTALNDAWKNAALLSEREHVTPYIRKNPGRFKLVNVRNSADMSKKRWTLDDEKDLRLIEAVLGSLYLRNPGFGMDDILKFLSKNPRLEDLNKDIERNEGYAKSLREDKVMEISRNRKNGNLSRSIQEG